MSGVALALLAVYGVVAFLFHVLIQLRLTGSTGLHGISRGSAAEVLGGVLFLVSFVLAVAAPLLDRADVVEPIGALDGRVAHVAGLVLAIAGILGTAAAQLAMGRSWRVGVDPSERTSLVTGGPFALVRNPIYTAIFPFFIGIALLVGNAVALLAFACAIVALELQTRVVEEPHLLRTHGDDYAGYAARVGRFVPGVGRLRR